MKNKKGLSNIVATVLIVLLAIAAVAIVWSFISPAITNVAGEVDLSQACFNSEVKPIYCNNNTNMASVQLLRGDAIPSGFVYDIVAVLKHTDGTTDVLRATDGTGVPATLGSVSFNFGAQSPSINILDTDTLEASIIVADPDDTTNQRSCDPSQVVVSCATTA